MDALTSIIRPLAITLGSSLLSQGLFWLKTVGIFPPVAWAISLVTIGAIIFYLCAHFFGWNESVVIAFALAVGTGLGIVAGL